MIDLSMAYEHHTSLPSYLWPETVGTMPIETPRYVEARYIHVDAENRAAMYGPERLQPDSRRVSLEQGRVAVMFVFSELGLDSGIVADFRHTMAGDNAEVNPQNFNYWDEDTPDMVPIVASIATDPETGSPETTGDPRFYSATRHLASLVDTARRELQPQPQPRKPYVFTRRDRLHIGIIR
ncbi:MAG: hypothetical protein WBP12_03430, partial [Candidatus Saccharimonas sp.]